MKLFVFTYSIVLISIKSLHNTANFLTFFLEHTFLEKLPPTLDLEVTQLEAPPNKVISFLHVVEWNSLYLHIQLF